MPEIDESHARAAYDEMADLYADHFRATEPEQSIELAMIDCFVSMPAEPRQVLDAGCGAGRMMPYLASRGCDVQGVDLSAGMIRRAKQDHPSFPSRVGSLIHLDYPDGAFDGVFSWYSTIHNPDDDLCTIIHEMSRTLRSGGHLLLAFQVGAGMREVAKAVHTRGYDIPLNRYHRGVEEMAGHLIADGFEVAARLERAPFGAEQEPQGVLIARKPIALRTTEAVLFVSRVGGSGIRYRVGALGLLAWM